MAGLKIALIALAALLCPQALANSQANFYWDAKCQDYAGSVEVDLNADVVGGPAGAQSMLWVNYDDACYDTCGRKH
ncbi:hypothetical protein LTR36_005852 [Oleoguttula mirabilis]|uniref:Uncharacterized protein n=1 Tax=Oleoguttula mirabilis TaxID=1507867 RepID=A0AAV9JD73_9PEZI|nr:hypothetical protein LTR36_005852 [Oleoguttula mirabilis]